MRFEPCTSKSLPTKAYYKLLKMKNQVTDGIRTQYLQVVTYKFLPQKGNKNSLQWDSNPAPLGYFLQMVKNEKLGN